MLAPLKTLFSGDRRRTVDFVKAQHALRSGGDDPLVPSLVQEADLAINAPDPEEALLGPPLSRSDPWDCSGHATVTAPVLTGDAFLALGADAKFPQRAVYGSVVEQHARDFPEVAQSRKLFFNTNAPFSAVVCGVQGSGKSHSTSVILESCLIRDARIGALPAPLSAIVFHLDKAAGGNSLQPCEAAYLATLDPVRGGSSTPPRVTVLAMPKSVPELAQVYSGIPGVSVQPLRFAPDDISAERLLSMMKVEENGKMPLYMEALMNILRGMEGNFNYNTFRRVLQAQKFNPSQKAMLNLRLSLLDSCLEGGTSANSVSTHFGSGCLTIVDLSSPFMDSASACGIFDIILGHFIEAENNATGKIVVLDEAHKYLCDGDSSARLTESLLSVIRQQRHVATRVVISTQEPTVVPAKFLELCSVIIAHRFSSPEWLRHLSKHISSTGMSEDDMFAKITELQTGEALLFAPAGLGVRYSFPSTDPSWGTHASSSTPQHGYGTAAPLGRGFLVVRSRLRITVDGGQSILAVPQHATPSGTPIPAQMEQPTQAAGASAGGGDEPSAEWGRDPVEDARDADLQTASPGSSTQVGSGSRLASPASPDLEERGAASSDPWVVSWTSTVRSGLANMLGNRPTVHPSAHATAKGDRKGKGKAVNEIWQDSERPEERDEPADDGERAAFVRGYMPAGDVEEVDTATESAAQGDDAPAAAVPSNSTFESYLNSDAKAPEIQDHPIAPPNCGLDQAPPTLTHDAKSDQSIRGPLVDSTHPSSLSGQHCPEELSLAEVSTVAAGTGKSVVDVAVSHDEKPTVSSGENDETGDRSSHAASAAAPPSLSSEPIVLVADVTDGTTGAPLPATSLDTEPCTVSALNALPGSHRVDGPQAQSITAPAKIAPVVEDTFWPLVNGLQILHRSGNQKVTLVRAAALLKGHPELSDEVVYHRCVRQMKAAGIIDGDDISIWVVASTEQLKELGLVGSPGDPPTVPALQKMLLPQSASSTGSSGSVSIAQVSSSVPAGPSAFVSTSATTRSAVAGPSRKFRTTISPATMVPVPATSSTAIPSPAPAPAPAFTQSNEFALLVNHLWQKRQSGAHHVTHIDLNKSLAQLIPQMKTDVLKQHILKAAQASLINLIGASKKQPERVALRVSGKVPALYAPLIDDLRQRRQMKQNRIDWNVVLVAISKMQVPGVTKKGRGKYILSAFRAGLINAQEAAPGRAGWVELRSTYFTA